MNYDILLDLNKRHSFLCELYSRQYIFKASPKIALNEFSGRRVLLGFWLWLKSHWGAAAFCDSSGDRSRFLLSSITVGLERPPVVFTNNPIRAAQPLSELGTN